MSKRNIKNIILLLILIVYSFVHKMFISKYLIQYSESITVGFLLLFIFLSIKLIGYQKDGKSKIKHTITKGLIILAGLYFTILCVLGIIHGFSFNSFYKTFDSMLFNLIIIVLIEIFRYITIKANKDSKIIIVLSTICIILFELFCLNESIINVVIRNTLFSYITYYVGLLPSVLYRTIIDSIIYIIPITPNISSEIKSGLYVLLLVISYLYSSSIIKRYIITDRKNENKLLNYSLTTFIVLLICLVSQIFPYCIIGIGSGSMEPELSIGDAVIVQKITKNTKISEGQIIVFNKNNIQVVHRVSKVIKEKNATYYRTKGDANNSVDEITITDDDIYGVVKFKIPFVAKPTIYLNKLLNGE